MNEYWFIPLIGSGIVGAILFLSFTINMKSMELSRKDAMLRQRPWIVSYGTHDIPSIDFQRKNKKIVYFFINEGPVPALDLIIKGYATSTKPLDTEKDFQVLNSRQPNDLGPKEWNGEELPMDKKFVNAYDSGDRVYFGVLIEYHDFV